MTCSGESRSSGIPWPVTSCPAQIKSGVQTRELNCFSSPCRHWNPGLCIPGSVTLLWILIFLVFPGTLLIFHLHMHICMCPSPHLKHQILFWQQGPGCPGPHYVGEVSLELPGILVPSLPSAGNKRCVPPCPADINNIFMNQWNVLSHYRKVIKGRNKE